MIVVYSSAPLIDNEVATNAALKMVEGGPLQDHGSVSSKHHSTKIL
jgi:hypothetical protein